MCTVRLPFARSGGLAVHSLFGSSAHGQQSFYDVLQTYLQRRAPAQHSSTNSTYSGFPDILQRNQNYWSDSKCKFLIQGEKSSNFSKKNFQEEKEVMSEETKRCNCCGISKLVVPQLSDSSMSSQAQVCNVLSYFLEFPMIIWERPKCPKWSSEAVKTTYHLISQVESPKEGCGNSMNFLTQRKQFRTNSSFCSYSVVFKS